MKSVITISGYPGSGTTTVVGFLKKITGLESVNMGDVFRGMAAELGMDVVEFADYVRAHPEIDEAADRRQIEIARRGRVILEGRLAGFMAGRAGADAYRVWIGCDVGIRAGRVARREGQDPGESLKGVVRREKAERERYLSLYGFDLDDVSSYDLVVDSAGMQADQIARMIAEKAGFEVRP